MDIPGLHRIFKNAKEFNWSAEKLLEKMDMASKGTYHARNYSKAELDLAIVVYELGGDPTLHALHHSPFAFPARTTLADYRRDYCLRISVGSIKMEDILANIKTMFENVSPEHRQVRITLCMDEIATDEWLCYLPESDAISGLCKHAAQLPSVKMGTNLDVIKAVACAVHEGKVHIGKEAFVAAFAHNNESDYGAKPVLILPTCKQGLYKDAALHIEMLWQAWKLSPYGEKLHGLIVSIASDGDPKRRPALWLHCMA